jgi:hypothetical protein
LTQVKKVKKSQVSLELSTAIHPKQVAARLGSVRMVDSEAALPLELQMVLVKIVRRWDSEEWASA